MPDTAPNEPKPIIPEVVGPKTTPANQEFDLLAFWIQYRKLIVRVTVIILIAAAIWGGMEFMRARKENQSKESLALAKDVAQLRQVIADWPGTSAAGSAHLVLADKLRTEGKYDEAVKALQDFSAQYPDHPLFSDATMSLGVTYELAGKQNEALEAYRKLVANRPKHSLAPLALIGQARILMAQNKREDAQKVVNDLETRYKQSPFNSEEAALLDELKNPSGSVFGGTPRPADIVPPPPPAPPVPPVTPGATGLPPGFKLPPGVTLPPGVKIPGQPTAPTGAPLSPGIPTPGIPAPGIPAPGIPAPGGAAPVVPNPTPGAAAPVAPTPGVPSPAPAPAPAAPKPTAPSIPAPAPAPAPTPTGEQPPK
jgi:predicted negative regulator of RcsB-dependent stress response